MKLDFVVIGFQKCGTCSVRRWLREHPQVAVPRGEVSPFLVSEPFTSHRTRIDTYLWAVEDQPQGGLFGTVDPTYALCDVAANARSLHMAFPDLKIITIERPRVERAYSAWNMAHKAGWDDRSFEDAIQDCIDDARLGGPDSLFWNKDEWLTSSYLEAGEYDRIAGEYQRYFEVKRLSLYDALVASELADFLGIDSFGILPHEHKTGYETTEIPEHVQEMVLDHYSEVS